MTVVSFVLFTGILLLSLSASPSLDYPEKVPRISAGLFTAWMLCFYQASSPFCCFI